MNKVLFYFIAVIALSLPVRAVSLDDAHAAFAAGKYHDSTAGYQAVVDARGYSAPVLFDLGNSYYREGNFPQAILAYKRALWLAPGDADILANLRAAQKQAGSTVEQEPAYAKATQLLSVNGWAWAACFAWTLLCALLLARAFVPAQRTLLSLGSFACVLALAVAIGAIILSTGSLRDAVVVDKNASALISPFPEAKSVFTPVPGETVRIDQAHNDYLLISDATGHSGWMAKTQLAPVVK